MSHNHTKRYGSALEHGQAHERDHNQWSRRSFIRNLGLAGGVSMFLNKLPLSALSNSPLSMALGQNDSNRILVLIRMQGGNDGLNTIIPLFDYGTYRSKRPTIHIPENQIINLTDEFGIPNYMGNLFPLWEEGQMKVINSVGYPDQNLSHFRSSDIWASASDANVNDQSGWLGRLLDNKYPDYLNNPPTNPPAIQIGGTGNILFNNTDMTTLGVIVNNPEQLAEIAETGVLYDPNDVPDCYYGEQLRHVRTVANSTFFYADIIAEAFERGNNAVEYEQSLGEQLALVARLIKGNLGTQLYMVSIDGFDTHASQNNAHPFLLSTIANEVQKFFEDLTDGGCAENVLAMTYSEFGRRIEQNASAGTDHGAAAPMMLFGAGLNGNGVLGKAPDLQDVDDVGNLKFGTDFREIYATVLENWLCLDKEAVDLALGQSFDRMGELGLSCNPTTPVANFAGHQLFHKAVYQQDQILIQYELPHSMPVRIDISNVAGQHVTTLFDGMQSQGQHQIPFSIGQSRIPASIYIYSIRAGNTIASQKIRVAR